jgi:hypothetical protein
MEGRWDRLPDFDEQPSTREGTAAAINFSPRQRTADR